MIKIPSKSQLRERRLMQEQRDRDRQIMEYCQAFRDWAQAIHERIEREPDDPETPYWETVRQAIAVLQIPIVKSNLLWRLLYGGEQLRTTPCPIHKGHWSGCTWEQECDCQVGENITGWLPHEENSNE